MSAFPASLIQRQIGSLLNTYGEPLTFERGGFEGTHTNYTGFVNELAGLIQPVLAVYLDRACSGTGVVPAILDTFVRDSVTYAVQKIGLHRVGSTVVSYIIFAAQVA